ncbi:MAG: hypothetical protein KC583_03810, partial [Myxococcales bacterium]|nr:hypothetical protein [Myxococcales bacterium]
MTCRRLARVATIILGALAGCDDAGDESAVDAVAQDGAAVDARVAPDADGPRVDAMAPDGGTGRMDAA